MKTLNCSAHAGKYSAGVEGWKNSTALSLHYLLGPLHFSLLVPFQCLQCPLGTQRSFSSLSSQVFGLPLILSLLAPSS